MSTTAVAPAQIATQNGPAAMPGRSFPAIGGSFRGPFRVDVKACSTLPRQSQVRLTESDVIVDGKYDPPGNGLYAFLATIGSVLFVVAMLQAFSCAAAPGWFVWYLIIVALRRKTVAPKLSEAKEIVADPDSSRVAFCKEFRDKDRWFAVELGDGFGRIQGELRRLMLDRVHNRRVDNASSLPAIVLITLILAAVGASVFFMLNPIG